MKRFMCLCGEFVRPHSDNGRIAADGEYFIWILFSAKNRRSTGTVRVRCAHVDACSVVNVHKTICVRSVIIYGKLVVAKIYTVSAS